MAQEMDDGKFWLPTEFLNDEDMVMDFKPGKPNYGAVTGDVFNKGLSGLYSTYGFGSHGPNSDLSSPVESVMGSTETESDEEDYLNGLTQKLAHYTLEDDFWKTESYFSLENHHSKSTRVMAGSPQSTLCGCKQISSRGSPNCPSPQVTAAQPNRNESDWDLLYAAAGEVARMRMAEEAASRYYNPNRNYIAPQLPRRTASPDLQFQQLQAAQFQQLKQQQMMKQHQQQQQQILKQQQQQQILKQQQQQMMLHYRERNGGNMKPVALPLSAWPTLQQSQQQQQQPPGSGMRAVFLGNPNTKRECTGTGVFLPRQIGAPAETRKKRVGCSTVLLPDRVVQALNLNLEARTPSSGGRLPPDYDAETRYRNSLLTAEQRWAMEKDLRLPQDWTY